MGRGMDHGNRQRQTSLDRRMENRRSRLGTCQSRNMQNQCQAVSGKPLIKFPTNSLVLTLGSFVNCPDTYRGSFPGAIFQRQGNDVFINYCHISLAKTGAQILVFRVTNFCLHCRFHHKYMYEAPIFACAMKFLAFCRWWLEAAGMECSMGIH